MNNTTLKKISEVLGISISTVSRALKHHPDISIKTREKVIELAEALDYEPNANAVQLRTRNSKLLGLLVPSVSNYFYETFIAAIEEEARKLGFAVMILQSGNNPTIENDNLKLFRQNRVSAVFVCISSETIDLQGFHKLQEMGIPVIFFDNVPEGDYHKVCLADEQAAKLAADLIIEKQYGAVLAIMGHPHLSITEKRLNALQSALAAQSSTKLHVMHASSSAEAKKITDEMLNIYQPDAIFCMSDEILIGTIKSIQEKGLQYPDNIALFAISNGVIPTLFHPQITYIETSGDKLGRRAFTHMMECLEAAIAPKVLIVEAQLVAGGSV